jgi:hypothetical protein
VRRSQSENGGGKVLDEKSQATLLDLLIALPHGVEAMNYDIEGLVETSNNLATISMTDSEAKIGTSTRSSIKTALQALRDRISADARLAGASIIENEPYPGWMPNVDSDLLKVFKGVHKEVFGEEPKTIAIHAGLECGREVPRDGHDLVRSRHRASAFTRREGQCTHRRQVLGPSLGPADEAGRLKRIRIDNRVGGGRTGPLLLLSRADRACGWLLRQPAQTT